MHVYRSGPETERIEHRAFTLDDCEAFYAGSADKTHVIPFAVEPGDEAYAVSENEVRARYDISGPYFYLPNQFWRHKNHAIVIDALRILQDQGLRVTVVASGASVDPRHPALFDSLVNRVRELALSETFRFLRLIPRTDVSRPATALAAPSRPSHVKFMGRR